jgi:hypothetical protein
MDGCVSDMQVSNKTSKINVRNVMLGGNERFAIRRSWWGP